MEKLVPLTEQDIADMAAVQAAEWGKGLPVSVFARRNELLYSHPFAKQAVHLVGWKSDDGKMHTTCNLMEVDLLVSRGGKLAREKGTHLASVVTPAPLRGRGAATRMLHSIYDDFGERPSILFSDVGAPFYERFGFTGKKISVREVPAGGEIPPQAESVSQGQFLRGLEEHRGYQLLAESRGGDAVICSVQKPMLDWRLVAGRFYAELRGEAFPDMLYWRIAGSAPTWFLAYPDYRKNNLLCFWMDPLRPASHALAGALAKRWGFPSYHYWGEGPGEVVETDLPMVRLGTGQPAVFCNPQPCDWW